ncbi:exodeoxyribonuclease V subunit gamma [Larsenimonas salina]|uniref:exodeoxyribonuclease V subunit gamma n=1 Tax=Larsenimonas salina TaxID=1295565 RepID=UPI002072BB64|nr:exodeoxyribonuclease V subunit gamma [Larsenimonas salina]MCM5703818.1 exodeoxyribonuclease V subunit gamma [Larsenimonas salina]
MFTVIHANHVEDLKSLALSVIERHPLDPLDDETFIVQSNGMAQWLRHALAEHSGIAAALDFPMPSSFAWRAYRAVLGDAIPERSPFDKSALTWRLMRLLPALITRPEFEPLAHYLEGERYPRPDVLERKRYQLAAQLADLFDQYLVYRPEWMAAWQAGEDAPDTLRDDERWQPMLWRALLEDAQPELRDQHRAALHERFLARARALETVPAGLPGRVFVFGISALPMQVLDVLHALSNVVEVVLLMTNPCRYYWGDVVADREVLGRELAKRRHADKPGLDVVDPELLHLSANPMLASWGTQGRDFLVSLYEFEAHNPFSLEQDLFRDRVEREQAPLLHQLQQDILDLTHPSEHVVDGQKRPVPLDDDSVALVSAHSPLREVEILRDRLLDAFERRPGLKPRDVIVMVPDINAYAPLIEAVFGQISPSRSDYIPYTIADQQATQADPLLVLVLSLLDLPNERLGVSTLLDWLDVPAFRQRFSIDDAELELLGRWLRDSGVRWGMDGAHRERLGLPPLEGNTWMFGLKRMLLGYANGDSAAFADIEPFDEVGGIDAALAGRLAELLETLMRQSALLECARGPEQWQQVIVALIEATLSPESSSDWFIIDRLQQSLTEWVAECQCASFDGELSHVVVRDALQERLDAGGLAQRFLAGKVNFATLMPMRAIPFREVVLLGMNDGDYPRARLPQDFDLMAARPRAGDRSRRDDDRYLFLEALLSARERLTLSWVGRDQRDNTERVPSVLVGELIDTLDIGWCGAEHGPVLEQVLTEYPLQPFSRRYFDAGRSSRLWTFDEHWARLYTRVAEPSVPVPEAALPETPLTLSELERLLRRPFQVCLGARLGIGFQEPEALDDDREPFSLNALDVHQIKQAFLEELARDSAAAAEHMTRWQRRGALPALGFGEHWMTTVETPVTAQWAHWQALEPSYVALERPLTLALTHETPHGAVSFRDRLDGFRTDEAGVLWRWHVLPGHYGHFKRARDGRLVEYGKPHRLFGPWVAQQCASACGQPFTLGVVFEDRVLTCVPPSREEGRARLESLLELWAEGWQTPLPSVAALGVHWWSLAGADDGDGEGETGDPRLERLRERYEEGIYNGPAPVRRQEPAMNELWPNIKALMEAGFERVSESLYGAFWSDLSTRVEQTTSGGL